MMARLKTQARRLVRDRRGMSTIELAICLPLLLSLTMTMVELINFVLVRQQVSQLALQIVDNATRIGTQNTIQTQIDDKQVNDLFTGASLQGVDLDLEHNGRIILSSLEVDPNNKSHQYIHWQRCYGGLAYASSYGAVGDSKDSPKGMGPSDGRISAMDGIPAMFVEIGYQYKPLIWSYFGSDQRIQENASMLVRDSRDTAGPGINPVTGVTPASC